MDLKRVTDVLLTLPVFVVSLPVQGVIAGLVRLRLGGPIFFRQPRPGLHGETFEMVKFRTMLEIDETRGLVTDEDRMTGLGNFLRRTSLDELPTLWTVLRGDMSLVGPRPLLVRYLARYTPEQARRHDVRPGLTGLAQVSGRNSLSWEAKFQLDVEYVDNHTLRGDIRILWATAWKVLMRDGISAENSSTMPEFKGRDLGEPDPGL